MKAPFGATAGFQVAGTLLLLSLTLTASKVTSDRQPWALLQPLETVEMRLGDFTGIDNPPLPEGVLKELKPTSYLARTYSKGDLAVDVDARVVVILDPRRADRRAGTGRPYRSTPAAWSRRRARTRRNRSGP